MYIPKSIILTGLITGLLFLGGVLPAQAVDPVVILNSIDEQQNFEEGDGSFEYTFVTDKPREERSIFTVRIFRRDRERKFLMLILEPVANRGEGFLQHDDIVWAYDPGSREFSISTLESNVGDSEAQGDDFNASGLEYDYNVTSFEEGMLGRYPVYILDLQAARDTVSPPRQRVQVRRDNFLLLKEENFSLSNRLVSTRYITKYVRVSGRFVASEILSVDNLNPGEQSQITIRDVSFEPLPDIVFTKSYLEQVNK